MECKVPNPWLLLGAICGPGAIVLMTGSGGSLLIALPIIAGAICGLSILFTPEAKHRRRKGQHATKLLLASVAVGMLCSLTSLTVMFGACAPPSVQSQIVSPQRRSSLPSIIAERRAGLPPESEWNRAGVWYRVSENPSTYLPVDYPRGRPRTETEGVWVVDERDDKRFFIPNEGTKIKRSILHAEAVKRTNWQEKTRRDLRH